MPRVERFDWKRHLAMLEEWLRLRGGPQIQDVSALPPTGFVVDDAVIGFLYRTDASQAFVGNFISDPRSNVEARREALDALMAAIVEEARGAGYRTIVATTRIRTLAERFKQHGFDTLGDDFAYVVGRV